MGKTRVSVWLQNLFFSTNSLRNLMYSLDPYGPPTWRNSHMDMDKRGADLQV